MQKLIAMLFAAALGLLAGCAAQVPANSASGASSGGSGITVFGTIDAAVSGTRNR